MPRLTLQLLGTFQAAVGDQPVVGFESEKSRALLAYLAVESDRRHRRERLAGLLWPEFPEPRARQNLSQALSNIRAVIGDRARNAEGGQPVARNHGTPFLDVARQTVQMNPLAETWVDVEEFTDCRTVVGSLSVADEPLWDALPHVVDAGTVERLSETVTLYGGPFLDGFSLADCADFEEWSLIQRERCDRLLLETLRVLTASLAQQGDLRGALSYAWRTLELNPWRENAHRQVMGLLAMTGQRTAALAQFDVCRRMLADEMGVDPEPATVALFERIKSGTLRASTRHAVDRAAVVDTRQAPPASRMAATLTVSQAPAKHNLPATLMPCIGRDREVAEIVQMVTTGPSRLITLLGPGGIGKTRLALAVGQRLVDDEPRSARFPDGIFFVSLAAVDSAGAIAPAVARQLGLSLSAADAGSALGAGGDSETTQAQLLDYLREKRLLLMLDNFEHLVDEASLCTAMLQHAAGMTLLITSRVRLNTVSECVCSVAALEVADAHSAAGGSGKLTGAVALFAWSARRIGQPLRLEGETLREVVAICRDVGGVPLGVLLAASWLPELSPAEIRRQLSNDSGPPGAAGGSSLKLDFLRAEWPDLPDRHRSMRQVFEQSWRLLTRDERALFRALSVFRGGFTHAAAGEVVGARLYDLRALSQRSLIGSSPDGRLEMHELLREFAAEKLALHPATRAALQNAHAGFYTVALEALYRGTKGPRQQDVIREMDDEIANASAAWAWMVASGDVEGLSRSVDGLCIYYGWRDRKEEALAACDTAWNALKASPLDMASLHACALVRAGARIAYWRCWFAGSFGPKDERAKRMERATRDARRVLGMVAAHRGARGLGHACDLRAEEARLLAGLAEGAVGSDKREAQCLVERALLLAREVGDRWLEVRMLRELGYLAWHLGETSASQASHAAALEIDRELGDLRGVSEGFSALSAAAMFLGQAEESARLAEKGLEISEAMGDFVQVAGVSYNLAMMYVTLGRYPEALGQIQRCQAINRDLGRTYCLPYSFEGWIHTLSGDYARGRALQVEALEICSRTGGPRERGYILMILGNTLLAEGRLADAVSVLQESVETYRPIQQPIEYALSLAALGRALALLGQNGSARPLLAEAIAIGVETGNPVVLFPALVAVALLWAHAGRCAAAAALYRTFARAGHARVAASPYHVRVGHTPLAALCPGEDLLGAERVNPAGDPTDALLRAGREALSELTADGQGDAVQGSEGAGA